MTARTASLARETAWIARPAPGDRALAAERSIAAAITAAAGLALVSAVHARGAHDALAHEARPGAAVRDAARLALAPARRGPMALTIGRRARRAAVAHSFAARLSDVAARFARHPVARSAGITLVAIAARIADAAACGAAPCEARRADVAGAAVAARISIVAAADAAAERARLVRAAERAARIRRAHARRSVADRSVGARSPAARHLPRVRARRAVGSHRRPRIDRARRGIDVVVQARGIGRDESTTTEHAADHPEHREDRQATSEHRAPR
jgi:hypothetical protein